MSPLIGAVYVGLLLMAPSASKGFATEGPSESECRPFIEKALQEVNTPQSEESSTLLPESIKEETSAEGEDLSNENVNEGISINDDEEVSGENIGNDITEENLDEPMDTTESSAAEESMKSNEGDTTEQQSVEDTREPEEHKISATDNEDEETMSGERENLETEGKIDELFEGDLSLKKKDPELNDEIDDSQTSTEDSEDKFEDKDQEILNNNMESQETEVDDETVQSAEKSNDQVGISEKEDSIDSDIEEVQQTTENVNEIDKGDTSDEQIVSKTESHEENQSQEEISQENSIAETEDDKSQQLEVQPDEEVESKEVEEELNESQEPQEKSGEEQLEQILQDDVKEDEVSVEVAHEVNENLSKESVEENSVRQSVEHLTEESDEEKAVDEQNKPSEVPLEEETSDESLKEPAEESVEKSESVEKLQEDVQSTKSSENQQVESEELSGDNNKIDQSEEEQQSVEKKLISDDIKEEGDEEQGKESELIDDKENDSKPSEEEGKESESPKEEGKESESPEEEGKESESPEEEEKESEPPEEEELIMVHQIPEKLRAREHMAQILHLDGETEETENILSKTVEHTLKELKKLYDAAIKPLEILYKYRDLSNRHFGDPEIFSKPLILFMGPWSGGKSTIINYLLENEYKNTALRTGADPSPAYFNIVMWGDDAEVVDGTQLAADWTFSGLQKFGQVLLDRLRGLKLNHPLLQKVNIVEIPGILEIRKQVERLFPFNDACQWFIDRADIIFLVYDPSKLDIGPETEAILDQLKGREMQTRIILNKADQVKPEELMRVQGTLIWNISPLMSSTEPPVMYSTSLWSLPYEAGSPTRLLHAQEKAFLSDLRSAIDKRVENKIAGARRFAVRVRNHAKMVDCYLTTYYNHKSFFDNKKHVSDDIIEHPQNYHIYEGLSTLTNISRYDLPDPDVYRDFFRLNPVYEFQQLSATCTYFRGCPINRLDLAIAYDLPELIGKYKKSVEDLLKSHNSRK